MKKILLILFMLLIPFALPADASRIPPGDGVAAADEDGESFNVADVIFEHVGDSYEWHFFTTKAGKSVAIYLPVIVKAGDGWHCFSSRKLLHGGPGTEYQGLHIAAAGEPHEGKIVQADGTRPLDLSITKNVLSLIMGSLLLVVLVLLTSGWYRRHDSLKEAPKGLAAAMEILIVPIDEMARDNIGEADYRKYSPYLCTVFLFILLNNFLGIIPFFPGGANLTGNIACTLVLALFTFFTVNLTGTRHYYKEMFLPDVPGPLKPLMAVIEVFSAMVKPISLTIRLFANMLAGHIQILCMVCIIFIVAKYGGALLGGMGLISVVFGVFLDVLEMLISYIQAYIFTMLSSIYIGLAREKE